MTGSCDSGSHALPELLELHGPAVRARLAPRIPRCWQSVLSIDDVMQQTYTDAFLDIDRFSGDGERSFAAWLMSLARCNLGTAIRMLRAEKRGGQRRRVESWPAEDSCFATYGMLGATQSTPSRRVARDEACAALRAAIEHLPGRYRRVVQMYDLEGRSAAEIGEALGCSPGAIHMIRVRAHRLLQALMGGAARFLSSA